MNTRICKIICLTILTACAPKPPKSCNFFQDSQLQRVSWKGQVPVSIWIHGSVPSQYYPSIMRAMADWESVLGRPLFKIMGTRNGPISTQKDNENVIYWLNSWSTGNLAEQARTTIFWTVSKLTEADIFVNASSNGISQIFDFSPADPTPYQVDFESLMVHELGHVLGLTHNDTEKSVMGAYLANGVKRREISASDLESLKCEY